jgi:hypothetical protein
MVLLAGGGYLLYKWYSTSATAAAASATPASGATGGAPASSTPAPPAFSQLDSLFTQLVAAATAASKAGNTANQLAIVNGVTQTTFSAWNYFLAQIAPTLGALPDFQSLANQPDLNTPLTAPQYWALISPWLKSNKGLSGGVFSGLGNYLYGQGSMYGGL